jgi:hypothetical protein
MVRREVNRQDAKTTSLNFTTEDAEERGGGGDKKIILRAKGFLGVFVAWRFDNP